MEGGVPEADVSAFRECLALSYKNPYVLRLAFSAGIGGLLFGYDTGNNNSLLSLFSPVSLCLFYHTHMHKHFMFHGIIACVVVTCCLLFIFVQDLILSVSTVYTSEKNGK